MMVHPVELMRYLGVNLSSDTSFYVDAGNSMSWAMHCLNLSKSNHDAFHSNSFLETTFEFASMGWAIGAAIGASLGNRNRPIVCITGDGSMLMSGQELTVAIHEKLPVTFIILNDAALGMVKHGQRLGKAESTGWEIPPVNFAALAVAMGAQGIRVNNESELYKIKENCQIKRDGPLVLDILIDPEAIPPMGSRIVTLGTAT